MLFLAPAAYPQGTDDDSYLVRIPSFPPRGVQFRLIFAVKSVVEFSCTTLESIRPRNTIKITKFSLLKNIRAETAESARMLKSKGD
jgi:hypothetical protein